MEEHTGFERNNLDETASPYLLQHRHNPVWWQPWSQDVLDYARSRGKPLFVSVGYATCHWCHVMAAEAFSDPSVAARLNRDFVCIKVDREERPDVDHFLMQFLLATRGNGGWPLNVFLTEQGDPFFAMTYAPVEDRGGMPGFLSILGHATRFHGTETHRVSPFELPFRESAPSRAGTGRPESDQFSTTTAREALHRAHNLVRRADRENGGFGSGPGPRFPPHSSLLYMLHAVEIYGDEVVEGTVRQTLNVIARRGLHDHLQGGFFRYCVDARWTIPHFEKMLYDQAMLLWVYALAWKVLRDPWYRQIAIDTVRCLEETFATPEGVFISAHDADTDHHEGLTYLWSDQELRGDFGSGSGSGSEVERLREIFQIEEGGNFEGAHHLVRHHDGPLNGEDRELLQRMLQHRRTRLQPDQDDKIVTAWNALAGIALVYAGRFLEDDSLVVRARTLYETLARLNRTDEGRWIRSSRDGRRNTVESLEDYGAVLHLVTLLAEHTGEEEEFRRWCREMAHLEDFLQEFRHQGGWRYTLAPDIPPVPADFFDSPTPSPKALAEAALIRSATLRGAPPPPPIAMGRDYEEDFHNLACLMQEGEFYLLEQKDLRPWQELPANTMQHVSPRETWCFRGACRPGAPPAWNPDPETV